MEGVECDVLEISDGFDVDARVLLRDGLQALEEVLEGCADALDNVIAQHHMVALALLEALVVK
jgi:hypothetical protein